MKILANHDSDAQFCKPWSSNLGFYVPCFQFTARNKQIYLICTYTLSKPFLIFEPFIILSKSVPSCAKCDTRIIVSICLGYYILEKFKLAMLALDAELLIKTDIDVSEKFISICHYLQNFSSL